MSFDSIAMSSDEVSPKSSFTLRAITPFGKFDLKSDTPCLNFDQNSSLLVRLSFNST